NRAGASTAPYKRRASKLLFTPVISAPLIEDFYITKKIQPLKMNELEIFKSYLHDDMGASQLDTFI
ncbi:MAG: hypothetical protein ABIN89_07770, partial [Chitinophagaceae bacterium]